MIETKNIKYIFKMMFSCFANADKIKALYKAIRCFQNLQEVPKMKTAKMLLTWAFYLADCFGLIELVYRA